MESQWPRRREKMLLEGERGDDQGRSDLKQQMSTLENWASRIRRKGNWTKPCRIKIEAMAL